MKDIDDRNANEEAEERETRDFDRRMDRLPMDPCDGCEKLAKYGHSECRWDRCEWTRQELP